VETIVLSFLERKKMAQEIITNKIKEANPDLTDINSLTQETQNELNDAVFRLTNVLGKVQYEVLNKETSEDLTVS